MMNHNAERKKEPELQTVVTLGAEQTAPGFVVPGFQESAANDEIAPAPNLSPKAERDFVGSTQAANSRTFGEKLHSATFDWTINFVLNLGISAAFTHWFKHSANPIWKGAPIAKGFFSHSPENAYKYMRNGIQKNLKVPDSIAGKMADALILTTGGHIAMIPSVWLGEKFKTSFVQAADKWHYGEKAANDPWIAHRHQVVNNEDKPTFLGTLTGRAGTVVAVQVAAMSLGDRKNMLSTFGGKTGIKSLEKFKGLDHVAGRVGDVFGQAMATGFPKVSKQLDKIARNHNFAFSTDQISRQVRTKHKITSDSPKFQKLFNAAMADNLANNTYDQTVRDFSKYIALDTLYTWVTMATVKPIINAVNGLIPGITYKEAPFPEPSSRVDNVETKGMLFTKEAELAATPR